MGIAAVILTYMALEVLEFNKKTRVWIGLVGSIIICVYGIYGLITEQSISNLPFVPVILSVGGFVGVIGNIIELKK